MQREIHNHAGRRFHVPCVYIRVKCGPKAGQKPGDRTRLVKTGTLCFYCGFTPSDFTTRAQHQVRMWVVRGE